MSRRQDRPTKQPPRKEKAEKPSPIKPKETPEQMRHRIRKMFQEVYGHEKI